MDRKSLDPATLLAHAGGDTRDPHGSIVPPLYPGTTFARDGDYALLTERFSYARSGTPNWEPVERVICELEGGARAFLFSSGLAASNVLFQTLRGGDHALIPDVMYHGMRDWAKDFTEQWGIGLSQYKAGDLDSLAAGIQPGKTRIVWVESPANPSWQVTDISAAAEIAHGAGALCVADSTVATPLLTRPISLGADFVVHSATKYLNGHSDVLGGILVAAESNVLTEKVASLRTGGGAVLGAFEAWLLLRGLRTLDVRVKRACDNAMAIASHFENSSGVEAVLYPGLASHAGHEVACRQMQGGFGAMLSILVDGDANLARKIAGRTRIFRPATSLGGVESLIEHRASVESPDSPVPKNLLRLSIGIESAGDLIADLEQAIAQG